MRYLLVVLFTALATHVGAQEAQGVAGERPSIEEQQSGEAESGVGDRRPTGIPVTIVESPEQSSHAAEREKKSDAHEASDLDAQVRAANAAERSAATAERQEVPAWAQIIIGALSTLIAIVALIVSVGTAIWAIRTTRAQTRAYVHAESADLLWGDREGKHPLITVFAKNTGLTPAPWFEARYKIFSSELNEKGIAKDVPDFRSIDFSGRPWRRWNALGSQSELSFPAATASDLPVITAMYKRRDVSLNIAGAIRYVTFFGEVYESEFWFVRRAPPPYRFIETSRRETPGLTVTEGHEKTIPLQRASCAVNTFAPIRKRWWRRT